LQDPKAQRGHASPEPAVPRICLMISGCWHERAVICFSAKAGWLVLGHSAAFAAAAGRADVIDYLFEYSSIIPGLAARGSYRRPASGAVAGAPLRAAGDSGVLLLAGAVSTCLRARRCHSLGSQRIVVLARSVPARAS
jgi:hypothetical protein